MQATERAQRCSARLLTPPTFSWFPQRVPHRHNHRGQDLLCHLVFLFTVLISSLARLKQCRLSQLGPCQPKCPALQSLLCCPRWFRAPSFPLLFALTPLTCYSSAVVMWQSAAQRLLKSGRGQCEKFLWIPFVTTAQLSLPLSGSVKAATTVYHWMQSEELMAFQCVAHRWKKQKQVLLKKQQMFVLYSTFIFAQWRTDHFTCRPPVTSYLVHSELVRLMIPSTWHHTSRSPTEWQKDQTIDTDRQKSFPWHYK